MAEVNDRKAIRQVRHVFTVVERSGKSYWIRIGAAFSNYDGSETVLLDALPVNGRIQIRTQSTKETGSKVKTVASTEQNGD